MLHDAVAAGKVPNVVAVAADRDGPIYEGAAGSRAVGSDDPVTPDSVFRIMSMTKMVCTVAALQQVERGNLELTAPVDTCCPEFVDVPVLEGFDGDNPKLRPAGSRATVEQLVTHTTGLGYPFWNADLRRWVSIPDRFMPRRFRSRAFSSALSWPIPARRLSTAAIPTGWARSSRRLVGCR